MDDITAGMRLCLIGRAEDLQHILTVGIEDAECFCLLNNIDEDHRTQYEQLQWKCLLKMTHDYEQEHYRYGN